MALLSQADINAIVRDIATIIGDDSISTSILYKQTGSTISTWDPTDGIIPDMWTVSSVSSFKGSYTLQEIDQSGGDIEVGDVKFIITVSSVSGILSIDDLIVAQATSFQSATTYQVKDIVRDPLNICYFFQCRNI